MHECTRVQLTGFAVRFLRAVLIDLLHCSLLRMRDKAMSARVAIKRSSYYRNEWQITRKASFFRITTAKFLHK